MQTPNEICPQPIDVNPCEYWIEWLFLLASITIPIAVYFFYRDKNIFERSGSLSVFFAICAQFVNVNRVNKKHLINACRVRNGEMPKDISKAATYVGWAAFILGLYGTLIWGYGSTWF